MARKVPIIDVLGIQTVASLNPTTRGRSLKVYSAPHSIPERAKHFDFRFLKDTGNFGHSIARAFVEWNVSKQEATADGRDLAPSN